MEVHLTPELQAKLDGPAAASGSAPDDYLRSLVENYVDYDLWFRQNVKSNLEQLDHGEFLTHEEVGSRMEKLFRG